MQDRRSKIQENQTDKREGLTFLDGSSLRALELLGNPVYIYGFAAQRLCWANVAALEFWNAKSVDELRDRVLTPYSMATSRRLEAYRTAFFRGEVCRENWTYYPKGIAVTALARCTGVRLDGHDEAMLVEVQSLDPFELPHSEVRAIEALRHVPMMVSMLADDGNVLLRNPAAQEFFASLEHLAPQTQSSLQAMLANPADHDLLLNDVQEFGASRQSLRMRGEAGAVHAVQLSRIMDPATGEPALLLVQQDVSEFQNVTLQLAKSEAALDAVLSLNVAPSLLVSVDGLELLQSSIAAERLFHLAEHEAKGISHIASEAASWDALLETVSAKGTWAQPMQLRTGDGASFWALVSGTQFAFRRGEAILLTINDIDDLKKAETELESALTVERTLSEMQRRMLEVASHDFRTPLAIIDGAAQRLERHLDRLTPDQIRAGMKRIRETVNMLVQVLDSTIEKAKRNLVGMRCELEPAALQPAIETVTRSFHDIAEIEISADFADLPLVNIDRVLVEQALFNLIDNAIKYSDGKANIAISAAVAEGAVEVFIRDRGIGILYSEREAVFVDHVRGGNVGTRPGSGIGLAVVREIFRSHGGDVSVVDTDDGPGATLRIRLPL